MKTNIIALARTGLVAFGACVGACAPAFAELPVPQLVTVPHAATSVASPGSTIEADGVPLISVAMHGGSWHGGSWHGGGGWHHGGWHRSWGSDWDGGWIGLGVPVLPYYGYYAPYDGYYDEPAYAVPRYAAPARHYVVRMSSAHVRWCEARYRSYRPSDNSFQPSYGPRQQCITPYG